MIKSPNSTPWYKQFWPWFLIFLPMAAVVASITTLMIASDTHDSTVAEDYYKRGKAINQEIRKEKRAQALGLKFELIVTDDELRLVYREGSLATIPALTLDFYHPTLKDRDFVLPLQQVGNGQYRAPLAGPLEGRWQVRLEPFDADWRIQNWVALPQANPILMGEPVE